MNYRYYLTKKGTDLSKDGCQLDRKSQVWQEKKMKDFIWDADEKDIIYEDLYYTTKLERIRNIIDYRIWLLYDKLTMWYGRR